MQVRASMHSGLGPRGHRKPQPARPKGLGQAAGRGPLGWRQVPRVERIVPRSTASGGGGSGGSSGGSGGGGGGGGGDGKNPQGQLSPELTAILLAAGRKADSFPSDFFNALVSGKVTPEILKRYLAMESSFLGKLVWGFEGFRERLLADPSFFVKLGIEVGIGVLTKVTAEKTKREDNFWREIDFVGANVVMAIIADFMLTWLPAPTLSYAVRKASTNPLANMFAGCPDNAFQRVQPGMQPFSVGQRFGAIIRNGLKLLCVGFSASMLGVGMTNALTGVRMMLDPTFKPLNQPQDVLQTSAAYGVYMSVSSNLRYQIVAGVIEERGIETIFKGQHQLCHVLSFVVRTLNTFVGSLLWVDFVRLCGMQKAKDPAPLPAPAAAKKGAKPQKGKPTEKKQ